MSLINNKDVADAVHTLMELALNHKEDFVIQMLKPLYENELYLTYDMVYDAITENKMWQLNKLKEINGDFVAEIDRENGTNMVQIYLEQVGDLKSEVLDILIDAGGWLDDSYEIVARIRNFGYSDVLKKLIEDTGMTLEEKYNNIMYTLVETTVVPPIDGDQDNAIKEITKILYGDMDDTKVWEKYALEILNLINNKVLGAKDKKQLADGIRRCKKMDDAIKTLLLVNLA